MDSLVGYASDDENEERYTNPKDVNAGAGSKDRAEDDNYDNVRMDMTYQPPYNNRLRNLPTIRCWRDLESNSSRSNSGSSEGSWLERREGADSTSTRSVESREEASKSSEVTHVEKRVPDSTEARRDVKERSREKSYNSRDSDNRHRNNSRTRDERRPDRGNRDVKSAGSESRRSDRDAKRSQHSDRNTESRSSLDKHKRRSLDRDDKRTRDDKRDRSDKRDRDDKKDRSEKIRSSHEDKRRKHSDKSRDERRSKERHRSRDDRGEKKEEDRKRRKERSTSPRPSGDKRSSRSPNRNRNSPAEGSFRSKRSRRSRSPERWQRGRCGPGSRGGYEKKPSKLSILERLGIVIPNLTDLQGAVTPQQIVARSMAQQVQQVKSTTGIELPSYYNPAAMNPARYAEQIQKRRLLWGNKGEPVAPKPAEAAAPVPTAAPVTGANNWEATTFRSDQDGKMTAKFKRLMGMKEDSSTGEGSAPPAEGSEILKKQEEMFNSMEMQYEVARVATHTHRGLGLGFGTFQYPR